MITVTQLAAALSVFDADDKVSVSGVTGNIAMYNAKTEYKGFIDLGTGLVELFTRG